MVQIYTPGSSQQIITTHTSPGVILLSLAVTPRDNLSLTVER